MLYTDKIHNSEISQSLNSVPTVSSNSISQNLKNKLSSEGRTLSIVGNLDTFDSGQKSYNQKDKETSMRSHRNDDKFDFNDLNFMPEQDQSKDYFLEVPDQPKDKALKKRDKKLKKKVKSHKKRKKKK